METLNANQQQQHRKSCLIVTQYGDMTVVWESEPGHLSPASGSPRNSARQQESHKTQTRPIIMTFHDLGLNSELQFASFCDHKEVRLMLQTFTMIHVNFVGQQPDAEQLESGFKYPSCEQLAECIVDVCAHLRIRSFIALAVGAGAHIVSLLALMRPDLVDGLFLINPVMTSCSITEWLYFKMSAISSGGRSQTATTGGAEHSPHSGSPVSGSLRAILGHMQLQHPSTSNHHNHKQEAGSSSGPPSPVGSSGGGAGGGPRLRRLILSRNFLSGGSQGGKRDEKQHQQSTEGHHRPLERCGSASSGESERSSSSAARLAGASGRRPPYEYLMYHHFGPGKFQRYKRSDDHPSTLNTTSIATGTTDAAASEALDQSSGRLLNSSEVSQTGADLQNSRRSSSTSFSLDSNYLSTIGNSNLKQWHMQAAYRYHFSRLNAHNLWLFAQAFANRHSLNLRKDCGAAAHAAAAAATLGTSICSVFVGAAPGTLAVGAAQSTAGTGGQHQLADSPNSSTTSDKHRHEAGTKEAKVAALVAGTKVKRTFTCQTLLMCSSVSLHRERAFKLMSLLNPIQTTCIQTDQLLVLEEKPEKVCQALRLFLQGIGYSMSTYERRLRLGSAGAGSSAESASLPPLTSADTC